eukprot:4847311-Pleurochrysis_carterae.AAC.2
MREFDDLCRYSMTERHLSKYVSSTRVNSCDSFSGFAEAHEVTDVFVQASSSSPLSATSSRRALWPTLTVAATRRLATTMLAPQLKLQSWRRSLLMLNRWRRLAHHPHRPMSGGHALWLKTRKGERTCRLSWTP